MAFVPNKMDDAQIAFLANEITKSYMNGKNMGSQEEFAREYFNMYQNSMKVIVEEQRRRMSEPLDINAIMNEAAREEESLNSKMFR